MAKLKSGTRVYGNLLVDTGVDLSAVTLSTAVVGMIEYDGTSFYAVPNSSYGRGTIPLTNYTSGAGTAGSAATTDYALFPSANDTITLPIGTYLVTFGLRVANSGTTNSTPLQINIRGGGTAAGNFSWRGTGTIASGGAANGYDVAATSLGTAFSVTASSNLASKVYVVYGQGILKITTAGTIIPSYRFTLSAGGTTTLAADNYMILQQLDTQSAAARGPSGAGWG